VTPLFLSGPNYRNGLVRLIGFAPTRKKHQSKIRFLQPRADD
jgi:hypothetical protein